MDILRSDVSLKSIKDLMSYDIDIPVPFPKDTVNRVREVLSGGTASEQEVREIVRELEQQGRAIVELLQDKGVIQEADLERIEKEQIKSGLSLTQTLVNLHIINPDQMVDLMGELQQDLEDKAQGKRLEDLLCEKKVLTPEQVEEARKLSRSEKIPLYHAILRMKFLEFEPLAKLMEENLGIRWIRLSRDQISRQDVTLLPDHLMKESRLIPFRRSGNELHVAMANPRDTGLLDRIRMITGLVPVPYLAEIEAIEDAQKRFLIEIAKGSGSLAQVSGAPSAPAPAVEKPLSAERDSTVQVVDRIIAGAVNSRATDIHLEPQEDALRVRYRIDGLLYDILRIPPELTAETLSRVKVMAAMDITERRRPQDGHIQTRAGDSSVNLRAATLPTQLGEKIVLRVIDDRSVMRGLSELGMADEKLEMLQGFIARPHGMILVTGPMGSGKTTTLYGCIREVNTPSRNVVTIEDPIEYRLPGVNQVQVDAKSNLTFASGLRAILRQDANVMMVGEIRDTETAMVAARAATTGHLIFSTLHTPSAAETISTLRNLGVPSYVIAGTLVCIVAQRLVRRVCPDCARQTLPSATVRKALGLPANSKKKVPQAQGCPNCLHTGYVGRTGVYEILENTPAISELIMEEKAPADILKNAKAPASKGGQGFRSLYERGVEKVLNGVTTPEELLRTIVI